VRALVIGAGRMGRVHIAALKDMGWTIAGVSDPHPDALERCQEEFGLQDRQLSDDALAMLRAEKPDAVVIATTADHHARYVIAAAGQGTRFVLCEKPMATSLGDCDSMIEACERAGTKLAVNHQRRFLPQHRIAHEIVESVEFGGLRTMSVLAGNMGLAMNGSHFFEIFAHWTQVPVKSIAARFSKERVPNPRGAQFEDVAGFACIVTSSGQRLFIEAGADLGHGLLVVYMGPNGQLYVDELAGVANANVRQSEHRGRSTTLYGLPSNVTQQSFAADLRTSVKELWMRFVAGESVPGGQQARHALECLVACYASDERGGEPIAFEPDRLDRARRFPWA
jgi:predicted dehydrogenase